MPIRLCRMACAAILFLVGVLCAQIPLRAQPAPAPASEAQTTLRLFTGNAMRPEIMREIAEGYMRANPKIRVEIEPGGATLDQQQRMLGTVLTSKDPSIDLVLIDVLRPAQWFAAQWLEPLDAYLGAEAGQIFARMLPAYRIAATVNNRVVALPVIADAQVLYYRKDLLAKHGQPVPSTWEMLSASAQTIIAAEGNPALRGFETVGMPVESTVCTYLAALWGTGEDLLVGGALNLSGDAAAKPFELFNQLKTANVTPAAAGAISSDRVRQNLQSGNLIFGIGWSYAWQRMQNDADSAVKDRIGIAAIPGFAPEQQTSCLGGWQVGVSAFSRNKGEAARLARYLASAEAGKALAIAGNSLPVLTALYSDPDLLGMRPWIADFLQVLKRGRMRPVTPRYPEISEVIRTNMHGVIAGTKTGEAALSDLRTRLGAIVR